MNFSPQSHYKWFDIIDAINGYKTFQSIHMTDKNLIMNFINKINILRKITKYVSIISFYTNNINNNYNFILQVFSDRLFIYGIISAIIAYIIITAIFQTIFQT